MASDWPKWKDMAVSVLREGPGNNVELPIAPTMRYITYQGERYFRMPESRAILADGSYAGSYLWTRYWDERLAKKAAEDERKSS